MDARPDLNRLLNLRFERGVEPRGKRATGQGERSKPTGFVVKSDEVTGSELEFSNGYLVLAVNIPGGAKAIIKGPEAWMATLEAMEAGHVQRVVTEWLTHVSKSVAKLARTGHHGPEPLGERAPHETSSEGTKEGPSERKEETEESNRIDQLEGKVEAISDGMAEILEFLKQGTQPKQG